VHSRACRLTRPVRRSPGRDIRVITLQVAAIPRARTLRESDGFWKVIVDNQTGLILGTTLLGPESAEVVSVFQTAMLGRIPYAGFRDMIITHRP
jgi:pyruvate/2-oxoglutarate dehydrogenase complex dihydrolipoamide dehydrogenase (E3) component